MTIQSLAGLAALNVLYLACGTALLWLLQPALTWIGVARFVGLAYLAGVVLAGSTWTLLLVAGIPLSLPMVVAVPVVFTVAISVVGRRVGRRRPTAVRIEVGPALLVTAVGVAATGVLLEGLFRISRLPGLYAWDAWAFWVPKAKAIYFFGGLDEGFFTTLPGASYPPLIPVLDAAAFHLIGGPDVVTLHAQYWLFGVGFVWALAGLLSERVPQWIVWPFVLLLLVAPRVGRRFQIPEADMFLDFLFVLAAILLVTWAAERERWRLVVATLLLCGMVLTKREGMLLAALLVLATVLASARQWRRTLPALGAAAVVTAVVAAPWRIWYFLRGVEGEGPASGGLDPIESGERLWPSMRLAFDVLLSGEYWSVLVMVTLGALLLAALARVWMLAVFFGSLVVLVTLGGGWITWAISDLPITQELGGNPIVRYMGSIALLCAAASPLLLGATWSALASKEKAG